MVKLTTTVYSLYSCKNISSFLYYYKILKITCTRLLIVHKMLWSATSKQQKMLPVLQYAQLIHANNSLKFNGRHIRFLNLYLSLLIICLCVGAHTQTHTKENKHKHPVRVSICKNYGLEVKYWKRLIHPCSVLKKLELQRLFKTTILKCTFTYKCLKTFLIALFHYSIHFNTLERKTKAEVNINFLLLFCRPSCLFSYGIPCLYKIICFMPFLSRSASKFTVGCSFLEKGWQKKMAKNLRIYISRMCLRFCSLPWDLQNIRRILLIKEVLCGWHASSHTSITRSLTQDPKQIIYLLNFQLSNCSSVQSKQGFTIFYILNPLCTFWKVYHSVVPNFPQELNVTHISYRQAQQTALYLVNTQRVAYLLKAHSKAGIAMRR